MGFNETTLGSISLSLNFLPLVTRLGAILLGPFDDFFSFHLFGWEFSVLVPKPAPEVLLRH
jgi:hypothetical protein